jgi:Concanavalin A-like lectin/glucanases superfamily
MHKKLFCLFVIVSLGATAAFSQEAELVHLWQFDGDVEDTSGSGNHGVIDGGQATFVPGPFGQAISLGAGVGVTNAAPSNLPIGATDTWSMNIWLNLDETPANLAWLAGFGGRPVHAGDGSKRAYLQFDAGYYFWGHSRDVDSGQAYATDGIWHMYTITYDATEIAMYFDGQEVKRQATTLIDTQAVVGVGGTSNWDADLVGKYDDFSIWRGVLSVDDIERLMNDGTLGSPALASAPFPEEDATDVSRDVILAWTPGEFAVTHDVYLGTVFDDVNDASRTNPMDALLSKSQSATTYDPGRPEFGQTYYWRIDEVNGAPDNTVFKGETWSFTVEPLAYPVEGITATSNGSSEPGASLENTVNGSGLNENDEHSVAAADMWLAVPGAEPLQIQYEFPSVLKLHEMLVWNYNVQFELMLGFGVKDVTVEYSEDDTDWMVLGDVTLNQGTAAATYTANTSVAFNGVAAKYVKITVNSGYGTMGQFGLSEVRFLHIPVQAREPQPEDGATDVSVAAELSWRAGREAVSHEVSLGTDPDALALIDSVTESTLDPGALDLAATYYWKVTEVNEAEAISTWEGIVWSFTTQEYLVVDDFESYNDEDNVIYESWVDGWVNETGSTVGYLSAPFAEQTIVSSGSQSMPLSYDNAGVATAEAELDLGQNWTASGIQSLSLYFYGDPGNTGGQLYVKINGTKIAYDGSAVNLTRATWNLWNIDLAASGASLSNVGSLTIGIEDAGATGIVYIDDIRLYPEILEYHKSPDVTAAGDTVVGVPNDGDWPDGESPDLAIDDDSATKFLHRQGGAMATGIQVTPAADATIVTGLTFTTANDTPTRDPITFELSGSNAGIGGPYELIAAGDIVDFAGATDWPRFTKNATVIAFDNDVAYAHYQIVFPTLRGESEALMQIAEVELIGETP